MWGYKNVIQNFSKNAAQCYCTAVLCFSYIVVTPSGSRHLDKYGAYSSSQVFPCLQNLTTYRNHTSSQRQFKTGDPQGSVLSSTLFNIHTADIPPPRATVQVMANADDITITSTHTSTSAAQNTYNHTYIKFLFGQNNLTLNPDKQLALCSLQTLQNI